MSLIDEVDVILCGLKAAGETVDDTFSKFIAFKVFESTFADSRETL